MKIEAKKVVETKVDIDVDDRIFHEEDIAWKVANLLLDGNLDHIVYRDLHSDDYGRASYAAQRINAAFKMADGCIALIKEGKYEI